MKESDDEETLRDLGAEKHQGIKWKVGRGCVAAKRLAVGWAWAGLTAMLAILAALMRATRNFRA